MAGPYRSIRRAGLPPYTKPEQSPDRQDRDEDQARGGDRHDRFQDPPLR